MCDNGPWLAGYDETMRVRRVIRANCDSWGCEKCARRKQSIWRYRIRRHIDIRCAQGVTFYFVTLTRPPVEHGDAVWALKALKKGWHRTAEYFRRQARPAALEYVSVVEFHKSGAPHQHLLINYCPPDVAEYRPPSGRPMMRSRTLSARLEHYGYGWVHHIERVSDGAAAGRYVSKYLAKGLGLLRKKQRLITCSQNWTKAPPPGGTDELQWVRIPYEMPAGEAAVYVEYVLSKKL